MTDAELHAEAKRRFQPSTPSVTDAQWTQWLTGVLRNSVSTVSALDRALAAYPLNDAPRANVAPSRGTF